MDSVAKFSVGSVVSLSILLIAYFYAMTQHNAEKSMQNNVQLILDGLLKEEKRHSVVPGRTRVAVGFGACVDVVASALDVFATDILNATAPGESRVRHYHAIHSKDQMEDVFAYFFRYGAAAERFMSDHDLFNQMEHAARSLPGTRSAVGGNAPVMGNRFAIEGCDVLLAGQMSRDSHHTLHSRVKVINNDIEKDDIHIVLEYKANEVWGQYKAPRANRFIVHNDNYNPQLSSLEDFITHLDGFEPNLLVISGLQMLDNYPFKPGVRIERLGKVGELMSAQQARTKIHFEMASYTDESLFQELISHIIPYSDSLGMNEQELPNLHSMLLHGNITILSEPYPRVATVLDQMRDVWHLLTHREDTHRERPLTRLHVHTLAYQAIMTKLGSSWRNTGAAAAKASLTANRHVCGSDWIHTDRARIIMDDSFSTSRRDNLTGGTSGRRVMVNAESPVSCWEEGGEVEICIAPVLVCTQVLQTAGGGDNISSAGLVLQI